MTFTSLMVLASAALVCGICTVLVFHPDYDDSLLRRFALALLADGFARSYSNVAIIVWFGLCLFLIDHFYNFLKKSKAGKRKQRRAEDKDALQIQRQTN